MTNLTRIAALLALASTATALADRRVDNASTSQRNNTFWSETESGGNTPSTINKCVIEQVGGKIRINSLGGRGGSAAYRSRWVNDWTDSFTLEYEAEFRSGTPASTAQYARTGLAMGFGTFSSINGYSTGAHVQVTRTRTSRRLEIITRVDGAVVDVQSAWIAAGVHNYKLAWRSVGSTATLDVYVDGSATPLLSASGFESHFGAFTGTGMGIALFGSSAGNFKFENKFDNLRLSGDDHDDSDDSGWDDDDGIDDDDEDGIRGNEQLGADALIAGMNAAIAANAANGDTVLQVSAEDGGVEVLFMESDTEVRSVRVLASGATIVGNPRLADQKELEAIAISPLVTVSVASAINAAAAAYPTALIHEVELKDEDAGPTWKVDISVAPFFVEIPAN